MQYKLIQDTVTSIINAVQNSAISSVLSLKKHTFSAKVTNFPKTQTIKGTVTVGNQKNLESKVKDVSSILKDIRKAVISYKAPDSIKISNFPKFPEFPKPLSKIEITNFPKPVELKEIKVSNQPITELEALGIGIDKLTGEVKKLKLDPKITVQAPKPDRLVVPPANVSVTQQEIDYKKLAKTLSASIPNLDYEKLAKALSHEMSQMVITSGGGGGSRPPFSNSSGQPTRASLDEENNLITTDPPKELRTFYSGSNTYICTAEPGSSSSDPVWRIKRFDSSDNGLYANGDASYDKIATNYASYSYGA